MTFDPTKVQVKIGDKVLTPVESEKIEINSSHFDKIRLTIQDKGNGKFIDLWICGCEECHLKIKTFGG